MSRLFTAAEVQEAVDAGLVTWERVLDCLRNELHIPDGAIEEWRAGDRDLPTVVVGWVEREARLPGRPSGRGCGGWSKGHVHD